MTKRPDKRERLESLLKGQGLHRASEYFTGEEPHKQIYPDITEAVAGATRIQNKGGEIVFRKLAFSLEDIEEHIIENDYCLAGKHYFSHLDPGLLAKLCSEQEPVKHEELLFLDLETTGLAGGTGTYPILSGVGYFHKNTLIMEQFFMEDFDREEAVLREIASRVESCRVLVTYNGKTFDIPVLKARFMLHRIRTDLDKPHIDLLHPVRNLWRGVLPDCSLSTVEHCLFNIRRKRDIDGSMVPQVYFDYLRRRDPSTMALVFDHNVQDVISLASLLAMLSYFCIYPDADEITATQPQLGLSRLYKRYGDMNRSIECLERALFHCRDRRQAFTISCHIAQMYKRSGRWEQAVEIWESQIKTGRLYNLEPYIEMAKYLEHRIRDREQAIKIVERAISFIDEKQELSTLLGELLNFDPDKAISELTHRMKRLQRYRSRNNQIQEDEENTNED